MLFVCCLSDTVTKPPRSMAGAKQLLCLLLCTSLLPEIVTRASRLTHVKNYQVVRPRRFHTRQKRASEGLYPPVLQFEITVEGKDHIVHLEKNQQLIAKNYSETHYLDNGTEVTSTPLYPDHCYYHGHIKGEGGSSASFSACNGLSGYFRAKGQGYVMEPLKDSDSDEHALYKYEELRLPLKTCGVVNTSEDSSEPRVEETFSNDRERSDFLRAKRYIEMYVVADYSEFLQFGSHEAVKQRVFEAVNHVNLLYRSLRTHIALIGLEIWSTGDKISVEKDSGKTLSNILEWRRKQLLPRKRHDNIQFITYVDFNGDTIGLAQVSAMCTGGSGAINQDHASNVHGVASTMAHEMGHNLGMNHDDSSCSCSSQNCIMSPVLSSTLPTEFSSCSHQHFQSFVVTHTASCLRDVPRRDDIVSKPLCGNHFLEKGEECDCGYPEDCQNPCCDAKTCRLHDGAQCADGACCQDCKIKAAGSMCRRQKDDCDLAESCDGKSSQCPRDTFRLNGSPCRRNAGFCYNGKCPSHQEQCLSLWGTGVQSGPDYCYRRNMQGDQYSFCRKTESGYQACKSQDIMCGQLNCVGGTKRPSSGSASLTFGSVICKVLLNGVSGLVQNGTKCGENKTCINSKCTVVQRTDECSKKCPEHAVCNHLEECQFEVGFSQSSMFPSYAIVIIVLVVLLVIAAFGVGTVVYKRRTVKSTATPRSQQSTTSGLSNPAYTDSAPSTPQVPRFKALKGPMMVAPPPPPSNTAAAAVILPHQASSPQPPLNKPLVPLGKPSRLRAPPPPPAAKPLLPPAAKPLLPPAAKPPQPPAAKRPQPAALKPPQPAALKPVSKVLMPPTKARK